MDAPETFLGRRRGSLASSVAWMAACMGELRPTFVHPLSIKAVCRGATGERIERQIG